MVDITRSNPGNARCDLFSGLYPFAVRVLGAKNFLGMDTLDEVAMSKADKQRYVNAINELLATWPDERLSDLARQIRSPLFLAHVRASTGGATSRANCHPFISGRWSFMHNGQIGGYAVMQHVHRPAGTFQRLGHAGRQLHMVFNQQDSHANGTPQHCSCASSVTVQRPLRTPLQLSFKLKAW